MSQTAALLGAWDDRQPALTDVDRIKTFETSASPKSAPVFWIAKLLNRPMKKWLRVDMNFDAEENQYIAHCAYAMSSGVGETPERAQDDLAESILAIYDELCVVPENTLAPDSLELLQRLRSRF